jgi:uncharacterized protein (DUF1800 family)
LEPHTDALDEAQINHLLRRTQWGTTAQGRAVLDTAGLDAFVNKLFDDSPEPELEAAALRLIAYPEHPTGRELIAWWMHLLRNSTVPFRDVMAFFWHDHFATSFVALGTGSMHFMREQIETLRRLGAGNLRQLLNAMITDPAMLVWLDAIASTREEPNENLAREFYERFSLGVDNGYTQADIVETSRALTGYRRARDPVTGIDVVLFDVTRADTTTKTIFGQTGHFGFRNVVDLTLAERPAAEFICRRLFEHFCYGNAPAEVVAKLATLLRDSNYELRPVLSTIFKSRAFFAAASRRSHVKSPVESAVGLMRATGLAFPVSVADYLLTAQGQRPLDPPNVGGWPEDEVWFSAQSLTARSHFAHAVAINRVQQQVAGQPIENLLPPPGTRTPAAVVQSMASRLGLELTDAEAATYQDYLDTRAVVVGSEVRRDRDPFRGEDAEHISERVRGLLFLLTQHPSYLLR